MRVGFIGAGRMTQRRLDNLPDGPTGATTADAQAVLDIIEQAYQ